MALEKKIIDDKVEIVSEYKLLQIRTATIILDDGVEISRSFHRRVVGPLDDVSGETDEIKALAALLHTAEVKAAYQAHLKAQELGA
jgi:hypothetical protein